MSTPAVVVRALEIKADFMGMREGFAIEFNRRDGWIHRVFWGLSIPEIGGPGFPFEERGDKIVGYILTKEESVPDFLLRLETNDNPQSKFYKPRSEKA